MKPNRVISTAVLLLLLGAAIPAFAQKGEEEKGRGGGKAQPAQHQAQSQHAQKAQPQQHAQKAQPHRAQQARHRQPQRAQQARQSGRQQGRPVASNRGGGHYGRISDTSYRAHFGQGHSFHMIRPRMIGGYNRFQYGGYWFGFNVGWPVGWSYDDTVYVVYEGGAYYLYNLRHPGIHITLSIF